MSKQELIKRMRDGEKVSGAVVYTNTAGDIISRSGDYSLSLWAESTIADTSKHPHWLMSLHSMSVFMAFDGTVIMPHELMDEPAPQEPAPINREATLAKIERLELTRERIYPLIEQSIDRGGFSFASQLTEQAMAFTYSIEGLWDGLEAGE